jgi:GNAT superfamily N-acetyltransferase
MNAQNYDLLPLDRKDEDTKKFIRELSLSAYDDIYMAKEFPHDRANSGIFNDANFDDDLSAIILVEDKKAGAFVISHEQESDAWELGFFHILPEFQKKGLGSAILSDVEKKMKDSEWQKITMKFHSPRSLTNGVPAFRGDVLSFFTKRGYYIKEHAAGAYINTPTQFMCDEDKIKSIIESNMKDGFGAVNTTVEKGDYDSVLKKAIELCEREERGGWKRFFSESYSARERTGMTIIEKDNEAVAVAGYSFEPESPTVWGYAPQWGPLLADSRYRGRGLASWVIYSSLKEQFSNGAKETILWTGVNSVPAKIYQKFGFRLLCPWFALEKKII